MSALTDRPIEELEKDYAGHGYGDFKKDLVEITVDALRPIKENFNEIRYSQDLIDALTAGAERANEISQATMKRVRDAFGMGI
jgi:tryptophanyl-tRNA synthetase